MVSGDYQQFAKQSEQFFTAGSQVVGAAGAGQSFAIFVLLPVKQAQIVRENSFLRVLPSGLFKFGDIFAEVSHFGLRQKIIRVNPQRLVIHFFRFIRLIQTAENVTHVIVCFFQFGIKA